MARRLKTFVHVYDDRGEAHAFGPTDRVPAWAAKQMGDHCWVEEDEPEPVGEEVGSEPAIDEPTPADEKSPAARRRGTAH